MSSNEWLGVRDLARELGVPIRTIYAWRTKGYGPRGALFGRHLRFRRADIEAWVDQRFDSSSGA